MDHDPAQATALPRGVRGFDPAAVAAFGADDIERLMGDAGIIRNRAKIEATISNARLDVEMADGELDATSLVVRARGRRPGRDRSPMFRR